MEDNEMECVKMFKFPTFLFVGYVFRKGRYRAHVVDLAAKTSVSFPIEQLKSERRVEVHVRQRRLGQFEDKAAILSKICMSLFLSSFRNLFGLSIVLSASFLKRRLYFVFDEGMILSHVCVFLSSM